MSTAMRNVAGQWDSGPSAVRLQSVAAILALSAGTLPGSGASWIILIALAGSCLSVANIFIPQLRLRRDELLHQILAGGVVMHL